MSEPLTEPAAAAAAYLRQAASSLRCSAGHQHASAARSSGTRLGAGLRLPRYGPVSGPISSADVTGQTGRRAVLSGKTPEQRVSCVRRVRRARAMTAIALNVSSRILQAFFGSVGGLPRAYWFLWSGTLINRIGSFVMPMLAVYL